MKKLFLASIAFTCAFLITAKTYIPILAAHDESSNKITYSNPIY